MMAATVPIKSGIHLAAPGHRSDHDAVLRDTYRRQRRVNRQILESTGDDTRLKHRREASDPWSMAKDGKGRFSPTQYPELMRK